MTVSPSRRGLAVTTLVIISAFGPYVVAGLRTEQMVVYPAAAVVAMLTLPLLRPRGAFVIVLAAWSAYLAVNLIGTIAPPVNHSPFASGGSALAGLDNAALPLAVMLLVLGLITLGADASALIRRASVTLVVMMCVNTIAALMQFKGGHDWSSWYGGANGVESVSFRAAQLGRYSGFFNQPAEAGVLYSVAGICATYAFAQRWRLLTLALSGIALGGMMTVSKIFLFAGLPLIVVALLRGTEGRGSRVLASGMVGLGAWVATVSGLFATWSGADFLRRNLVPHGNSDLVQMFTASRYGDSAGTGSLHGVTDAVTSGPWTAGFGARGLLVAYDSGWVEALVTAGIIGVLAQACVFTALWRSWSRASRTPERTLLGFLIIVLAVGSLGVPTLTANRVATVVWVLLATCLVAAEARQPTAAPERQLSRVPM